MTRKPNQRDGVATTECAIAIPIILLFTLVTIDICTIIYLKESVTIAAYEGSRVGIQRGGTDALAESPNATRNWPPL